MNDNDSLAAFPRLEILPEHVNYSGTRTPSEITPAEVYRRLRTYTGPSPARALAAYHAIVTGQELPPAYQAGDPLGWAEAGAIEDRPAPDRL
jgi:hypothetical protein